MPKGIPRIVQNIEARKELAQAMPTPEVLGHIAADSKLLTPGPEATKEETSWTREDGTVVTLVEPPPPWEVGDSTGLAPSDARRFVDCPKNWRLHWINPKVLNSDGWRDWQAVQVSDPRVTLRVPTMKSPEGYVRRGGPDGDILCWMWMGWYESKRRQTEESIRSQASGAVERQETLAEEMKRGKFGPYITSEGHQHPRYTNGDGRTMRD